MTLSQARKRIGLTQDQLADRSGVDQTTISSLELGKKSPRFDTVLKLARVLGLPPDQLRFGVTATPISQERAS
jgi:transcriptional regulator with XRE-family HTH domain